MNDDTSSQVKASSANPKQQFSDFNFGRDPLSPPRKNQIFNGVVRLSSFSLQSKPGFLPFPIRKEVTTPSKRVVA